MIAAWLLNEEGKRRFVRRPEMVFFSGDEEITETGADRDPEMILVGTGGGAFDEHRENGRLKGACSATLVAEELGLLEHEIVDMWPDGSVKEVRIRKIHAPAYGGILREALRADTHRDQDGNVVGQTPLELGQLVKDWHTYGPAQGNVRNHDAHVFGRVYDMLTAIRSMEAGEEPRVAPQLVGDPEVRPFLPKKKGKEHRGKKVNRIIIPARASTRVLVQAWIFQQRAKYQWFIPGDAPSIYAAYSQKGLDGMLRDATRTIVIGIEGGQVPPEMTVQEAMEMLQKPGLPEKRRRAAPLGMRAIIRMFNRWEREEDPAEVKLFQLPNIVKALNGYTGMKTLDVLSVVFELLYAVSAKEEEESVKCRDEYAESAIACEVDDLQFCVVTSDTPSMPFYALKAGNSFVAKISSSGNVYISSNRKHAEAMTFIASAMVVVESMYAGVDEERIMERLQELCSIHDEESGRTLPGCAWWYYHREAGGLLNGSLTHEEMPTPLGTGELMLALVAGVCVYGVEEEYPDGTIKVIQYSPDDLDDQLIQNLVRAFKDERCDETFVRMMIKKIMSYTSRVND